MRMNRFTAAVIVTTAAGITLTGCGTGTHELRTSEGTPAPSATVSEMPRSSTSSAPVTPSDAAAENDTTTPAPGAPAKLTAAGIVCDMVVNGSRTLPVIVQTGQVDCQEALAVAKEYLARSAEAQGQGQFLTVQGWRCSWPYLPGRSHADSYLQCTDPTGQNTVSIGA